MRCMRNSTDMKLFADTNLLLKKSYSIVCHERSSIHSGPNQQVYDLGISSEIFHMSRRPHEYMYF
jgi:hypothetical protein